MRQRTLAGILFPVQFYGIMSSLFTVFKALRFIGLFPRRFIEGNNPNSVNCHPGIENNKHTVGPMSPLPLLTTILLHITMTVLNMILMWECVALKELEGFDDTEQFGNLSWNVVWVWASSFTAWIFLFNHGKLIKLNKGLMFMQLCSVSTDKDRAKFSKPRIVTFVLLPLLRITFFIIYHQIADTSTVNKIIWAYSSIQEEILRISIEFVFWQIAKLYRGIITKKGRLTLGDCSNHTWRDDLNAFVEYDSCSKIDSCSKTLKNNTPENITKQSFDSNLLRSEMYIVSIYNCANYAMNIFDYALVIQIVDLVMAIFFSLYFGIKETEIKANIFIIFEVLILLPRLIMLVTLSCAINREVCKGSQCLFDNCIENN